MRQAYVEHQDYSGYYSIFQVGAKKPYDTKLPPVYNLLARPTR